VADADVVYLTFEELIAVHAEANGRDETASGRLLRSRDGLAGAVARPQHHSHYGGADLALQAAVLAHGIAEGQVFLDGNKRTALLAMLTFLALNGVVVLVDDDELADWMLDLSRGGSVEVLADRIRAASPRQ
jgi:death-on-curing protein